MCGENILEILQTILGGYYVFKPRKGFLLDDRPNKHSIGLIIQPGPQGFSQQLSQLTSNPVQLANWWGHTAIYLRYKGKIVSAIGFDPHRLKMFNLTSGIATKVSTGKGGTEGYIYNELMMFNSPDLICIEFDITEKIANKLLSELQNPKNKPGKAPDSEDRLKTYVTFGGKNYKESEKSFDSKTMGNCIDFVRAVLNRAGLILQLQGMKIDWSEEFSRQGKFTGAVRKKEFVGLKEIGQEKFFQNTFFRMPATSRLPLRIRGAVQSLSLVRVIGSYPVNLIFKNSMACTSSEYLLVITFILDFLMETIPEDSIFWSCGPQFIEPVLEFLAKVFLAYRIYNSDYEFAWSWLPYLLILFSIVFGAEYQHPGNDEVIEKLKEK